jgi:hypothetical protein
MWRNGRANGQGAELRALLYRVIDEEAKMIAWPTFRTCDWVRAVADGRT